MHRPRSDSVARIAVRRPNPPPSTRLERGLSTPHVQTQRKRHVKRLLLASCCVFGVAPSTNLSTHTRTSSHNRPRTVKRLYAFSRATRATAETAKELFFCSNTSILQAKYCNWPLSRGSCRSAPFPDRRPRLKQHKSTAETGSNRVR